MKRAVGEPVESWEVKRDHKDNPSSHLLEGTKIKPFPIILPSSTETQQGWRKAWQTPYL